MAVIHLPEDAFRWAEACVAAGKASSVSAYIVELTWRDRERIEERARVIQDMIASGIERQAAKEMVAHASDDHLRY